MSRYEQLRITALQELGVDPDKPLTSELSGQEVASILQARNLLKKQEVWPEAMHAIQKERALQLFLEDNASCKNWKWQPERWGDDIFYEELKTLLWKVLEPGDEGEAFDLAAFAEGLEPGPGAVVGGDDESFVKKLFESQLTCTSEYLFSLFRAAICERPGWAEAELYRFNQSQPRSRNDLTPGGVKFVTGNTFFSVPKNLEIERGCATEPSVNQLGQKSLGRWTEGRLVKCFGIDKKVQQFLNRELARRGSITGIQCTLDLHSASNRNAMLMVEEFFPPSYTKWVRILRSPQCVLPDGTVVDMEMCSSMGNGFTFPLQTVLYASVVAVCYKMLGIPLIRNSVLSPRDLNVEKRIEPGNFGVWGDDIIVDRKAYNLVSYYLRKLGHVVNDDKSFSNGLFRESCGADWWSGYFVRSAYIKSLETPADIYSAINKLTRWAAVHEVNLSLTMRLLLEWVEFLPVPYNASDAEGVKVPYDRAHTVCQEDQTRRVRAQTERWQAWAYKALVQLPSASTVSELSGETSTDQERYSPSGNTEGLYVAALGGYIRTPDREVTTSVGSPDGDYSDIVTHCKVRASKHRRPMPKIGTRERRSSSPNCQVQLRVTSSWDVIPVLAGPIFGTDRGASWERVAARHEFLALLPVA